MTCAERIRRIQLLDKMAALPEYSEKLGLKDISRFREKTEYVNRNVLWDSERGK